MKKDEVQVGGIYLAKVGARSVEVVIESQNAKGGWNAKSVATGKPIRLKDPKHLRPAKAADEGTSAPSEGDSAEPRTKPAKAAKTKKAPREKVAKDKPLSCLDAAAAVLKANGEPMACRAMIDAMREQGLWSSSAPTPHATLFAALLREIKVRGAESRFRKADRGLFTLSGK
jgi:hypothetical protein